MNMSFYFLKSGIAPGAFPTVFARTPSRPPEKMASDRAMALKKAPSTLPATHQSPQSGQTIGLVNIQA